MRIERLAILLALFLLAAPAGAQVIAPTMTRSDFEQNVAYLGQTTCSILFQSNKPADNFARTMDWGDSSGKVTLDIIPKPHTIYYNGQNRVVVDPGKIALLANDHVYKTVQQFHIVYHQELHVLDAEQTFHLDFPFTVTVHPRTPLADVTVASSSIKGGTPIQVTVLITDVASAADARVDFQWTTGTAVLDNPPASTDIQSGHNSTVIAVPTKATTTSKVVTLTVSTVGQPRTVKIKVTP